MTRPAVATTLTARAWEPAFASLVRSTATLRLVARAYRAEEIDVTSPDVLLVGAEVPWVDEIRIVDWRRRGIRVIAIHTGHDRAARAALAEAGADLVLPDTTSPLALIRHAEIEATRPRQSPAVARVVLVTGPRGAPGRTTVSLMLAGLLRRKVSTALLDLDPPAIGMRLRLPPRIDASPRPVDSVTVFAGVHAPRDPARAVLRARASEGVEVVVVDAGPMPLSENLLRLTDSVVMVCRAEPVSLLRSATALRAWWRPQPIVVVNQADKDTDLRPVRAALGLEPVVVPTIEPTQASWPEVPESLWAVADLLDDDLVAH